MSKTVDKIFSWLSENVFSKVKPSEVRSEELIKKAKDRTIRDIFHKKMTKSRCNCSFCGKFNDQVERLIAGPNGVFICSDCVNICNESFQNLVKENVNRALERDSSAAPSEKIVVIPSTNTNLQNCKCSFCGKTDKLVEGIIAGNNVYICNECIKICNVILEDDKKSKKSNTKVKSK